ncbi:hypothetical protein LOTGIDRAFT_176085 [Lottia gigantea]|uniref:Uncharacterized protein n=1 Tax=Lottia gigantea TaxID=225164 RepID=V3ZL72_LOTGI|nr:hypothetical protein LOTGIDRAFT_176085 [Lottia gigantea]ESO85032.1 hypothetical protein LOTGIDRAFT_176085 [Lottia gigantea]
MANKFGLGSLSLETKKSNTTAWINKAKPYFLDQIGDTLQVNKEHLRERISDVKRFFKRQINNKDYIDDTKLQQEVTSLKNFIQQQLANVVDKTQLQTLDDKIAKQKIDLKQLIANINPGISEDKLTALESKLSDDSEIQKQIVAIQQQLINVVDKTQLQTLNSLISNLDDKITKQKIELIDNINPGKLTIEITFPIQVKVDSLFFRQGYLLSNKKFNAKKVLQFINGTKNVENKELEINDENTKVSQLDYLHEIKSSGKYIDRFRMLIIPDNEEDEFLLSDFDMLFETETPPSMNIIRNPEPQKKDVGGYEFLQATDFEYVKLYFVDNDIFTLVDIHKSQQNQRDGVYVNISIYIEKPKFSVHLNKINDSKEQISLVTVNVNSKLALSEIHLI